MGELNLVANSRFRGGYLDGRAVQVEALTKEGCGMEFGVEKLHSLNIEIGNAEERGDKAFFEDLLAPVFAMRRADGKRMDDRQHFIDDVKKTPRRETTIESITFFDANRALVICIVTMRTAEGRKRYHNVRLFTRQGPQEFWKLLAWANEPTPDEVSP